MFAKERKKKKKKPKKREKRPENKKCVPEKEKERTGTERDSNTGTERVSFKDKAIFDNRAFFPFSVHFFHFHDNRAFFF